MGGRRGGARKGAGRKKGWRKNRPAAPATPAASSHAPHAGTNVPAPPAQEQPPPAKVYQSAEDYLEAVVMGLEPPDRDRIAAAKAMLPYQIAKRRLPVKSDAPRQMELSKELEQEKQQAEEWEKTRQAVTRQLRLVGGHQG